MRNDRVKIERLLLLVAALALCALLIVRVTFAWFAANTSVVTVVTGDADLDVTFYRLRDFNRDGKYNYIDFANDKTLNGNGVSFAEFEAALKKVTGGGDVTAENFDDAYGALSDAEVMKYTYETDFSGAASGVNMGSRMVYRVRIANNSDRAADLELSFGNMMKYYYNAEQMRYYDTNKAIDVDIENGGLNILNYAAKFLFSLEYTDAGIVQNKPLWSFGQSETVFAASVAAKGEAGSTTDMDFSLVFDGQSIARDYLTYVGGAGQCYDECLAVARGVLPDSSTDVEIETFTADYIRAVYDAEMTYLFSVDAVAEDVNFRMSSICIFGTLKGQAVEVSA